MKLRLFLFAAFAVVFAYTNASSQATYKTEGHTLVIIDRPSGGDVIGYETDTDVVVKAISGSGTIYSCSDVAIGTITTGSGQNVPVNPSNRYWCFKGPFTAYSVSYGGVTYNYWPANDYSGFYNVRDFGAKGDDSVDDTAAIKKAVTVIGAHKGGTLYFPYGNYIVGESKDTAPITLPPGIVVQGATQLSPELLSGYLPGTPRTVLVVKSEDRRVFRIGAGASNIKIMNLALLSESFDNTIGLEAVSTGGYSSTVDVGLENVTFTNFTVGIKAHDATGVGAGGWQFDHIKIDHCYFVFNKDAGIWIDLDNTDWRIVNSQFNANGAEGGNADGIYAKRAGQILIESSYGATTNAEEGGTGDFIQIESMAALSVIDCEAEGTENSLVFGNLAGTSGAAHTVLTLVNNVFGSPVIIRTAANLISTGNFYLRNTVNTTAGVKIYSTGDRFCYTLSQYASGCGDVGTTTYPDGGFQGGGRIMFQTGQEGEGDLSNPANAHINSRPTIIGTDTLLNNDLETSKPILSIVNSDYTKPLLRLGQTGTGTTYTVKRDATGWLSFTAPDRVYSGTPFYFRGFRFDAPVELPSYNLADFPAGTQGNGALIYCADCKTGTNPCSTSGGGTTGALAMSVNSAWVCK